MAECSELADSGISRNTQRLAINFPSVGSAKLENLGTTLEVPVTGSTTIAGVQYNLKQFHFHTPSEHRIFEEYYPLEMHLVHEATDGSKRIAVLAVTFQLSQSTTELLTQVFKNIGNARKPGSVATTGPLNFGPLVNHLSTTPLFRYNGSLTTPPCAETVTFFITEKPLLLNIQTFNAVKSVIKFNSRYTQNKLGAENLLNRNGGLPAGHVSFSTQVTARATVANNTIVNGLCLHLIPTEVYVVWRCRFLKARTVRCKGG